MTWLLIIATVAGGIATAEFPTREQCEATVTLARVANAAAYPRYSSNSAIAWAVCVER